MAREGLKMKDIAMVRTPVLALLAALYMAVPAHSASPGQPPVIVRQAPDVAVTPLPDPALADRVERARRNLLALRSGTIGVGDLGPQDLQDVLDLDRMLSGGTTDNRSFAQRCVDDEVRRLNGRPSPLARRVIELKCRETGS